MFTEVRDIDLWTRRLKLLNQANTGRRTVRQSLQHVTGDNGYCAEGSWCEDLPGPASWDWIIRGPCFPSFASVYIRSLYVFYLLVRLPMGSVLRYIQYDV